LGTEDLRHESWEPMLAAVEPGQLSPRVFDNETNAFESILDRLERVDPMASVHSLLADARDLERTHPVASRLLPRVTHANSHSSGRATSGAQLSGRDHVAKLRCLHLDPCTTRLTLSITRGGRMPNAG